MVALNVWPTDGAAGSVATEARWRAMARLWNKSGVATDLGGQMAPTMTAFPNVSIAAGVCWVDGHYCELPGAQNLTVTANGLIVVRFDPAANTAELLYRDAVTMPAQNPTGTYELVIGSMSGSVLYDQRLLIQPEGGILFASTVPRDAAWRTWHDGQECTTLDTHTVWYRWGSAWYSKNTKSYYTLLTAANITNNTAVVIGTINNIPAEPHPRMLLATAVCAGTAGTAAGTWDCYLAAYVSSGAPTPVQFTFDRQQLAIGDKNSFNPTMTGILIPAGEAASVTVSLQRVLGGGGYDTGTPDPRFHHLLVSVFPA